MQALFWAVFLFGMALIIQVRFAPDYNETCEFCLAGIDTSKGRHIEMQYAVEMPDLRAYDWWFFCSERCEMMHLEHLADRSGE